MKVKELVEILQKFDPEHEVYFQYPSGDYWRHVLAGSVDNVEIGGIEWSEYHRQFKVLEPDPGGGAYNLTDEEAVEKADKIKEVVMLI